jgi:heptosyltransferase-1
VTAEPAAPGASSGLFRILIVKLSSLGDIVHALPVAASLRASYPGARLAWLVEQKWLPLVSRHPALDEVFTVDSHAFRRRPHRWQEFGADLAHLRRFEPDIALDLQGTLKSALLARLSRAPRRIGFASNLRLELGARLAYTTCVHPHSTHVVEQLLDLAAAIGPLQRRLEFPFPLPEAVQSEVDAWLETNRVGPFAFFSPGGGWASKRWPSDRYARLADLLERDHRLAVVINRGPGDADLDLAHRRAHTIRARLFSGDLDHLAAILRRARIVVGGDTGPLQLAAALGSPTVALFGPTDPARNGPYGPHTAVLRKTEASTYRRHAAFSPAMLAITPEEVAQACGRLLAASAR